MPLFTKKEFLAWTIVNRPLALAYCKAKAFAEVERERVDAYILPIFKKYAFREDCTFDGKHEPTMNLIDSPKNLYLSDDPRIPAYYEETYDAHEAHGWKGGRTYCPALVAENILIKAENAILESGEALTKVAPESLYGENRKKMLDLLVGACFAKGRGN